MTSTSSQPIRKEIFIKVVINGKSITNIIGTTGYKADEIQELELIGVLQNLIDIQKQKLQQNQTIKTKRWQPTNKK